MLWICFQDHEYEDRYERIGTLIFMKMPNQT